MELEKKAILCYPEMLDIQTKLMEQGGAWSEPVLRIDHYYRPEVEIQNPPMIRIREEFNTTAETKKEHSRADSLILTIKDKIVKDGYEINKEIEDEIKSWKEDGVLNYVEDTAVYKLIRALGFKEDFVKSKSALGTHKTVGGYNLHIEFVTVSAKGAGYDPTPIHAMEIEYTAPDETVNDEVVQEVSEAIDCIFKEFGVEGKVDGRSWRALLQKRP